MAKNKAPIVRLCNMAAGQAGDFFALLAERVRGARKDGKPYFTCRFRDSQRTATYMAWSDGPWFEACENEWREGQFYKIRGGFDEHKTYGPQIEIGNIRPTNEEDRAAGFDPLDFVERSRFDVEAMFRELCSIAGDQITDQPLRRLVLTILERTEAALKRLPATTKHFYPFAGGLIEHILSVTHTCIHLVDKYTAHYEAMAPPLNRDLVIAGAVLHDIGRCLELEGDVTSVKRSVPGHLFGHLLLGRDLVRDVAREVADIDPEILQLLEHLIVTHLNLPEWGSPRLPLIPECLILHHADDLDAKLEMYVRCLQKDKEPGLLTARDPALGKQLLKGRNK